jgi:hypothetical protein
MKEPGSANLVHIQIASWLALLVGAWLVAVNFILWAPVEVLGPWNHGILGLVVILLAGYRLARPLVSGSMSWVIAVLGVWLVASPFLFGYALLPNILWGDIIGGLLLIISGAWGGAAGGARRER